MGSEGSFRDAGARGTQGACRWARPSAAAAGPVSRGAPSVEAPAAMPVAARGTVSRSSVHSSPGTPCRLLPLTGHLLPVQLGRL